MIGRWLAGSKSVNPKPKSSAYKPMPHYWFQQPRDLPPFSFMTMRMMLIDPGIKLNLAIRFAPLFGVQFAYKQGDKWVPGVEARRPEVAAYIERQLSRIWTNNLTGILRAQIWGWSAGEITLRLTDNNLVEIDQLFPRHAADCRILKRGGDVSGVRINRVEGTGHVDLNFPNCWWHNHEAADGEDYGISCLLGAYSPWADKWFNGGAADVRRLFMHKDAYGGADLGYPEGDTYIEGREDPVPNQDIARQIVEQIQAGGVTTRPSTRDENGNEKWPLTRATVPNNPQHILQYPKDLDDEIRRGMGIPDDVITADGGGAWAGRRIPLAAFYATLDTWVTQIVKDLRRTLDPLIMLNFGKAEEYEICHKPLAEQAMEQQSNAGPASPNQGGGQPEGNGGLFRMGLGSIDPVEAIGRGVMDAAQLVKAARSVLRLSSGESPKVGDTSTENGVTYRFNENHRWENAAGFASPNTKENLTFDQALQNLESPQHAAMKMAFEDIDKALGLKNTQVSVVGDWGDGAEDSVLIDYPSVQDFAELQYAMAWKGKIADQKAVLAFLAQEDGKSQLFSLEVPDTIENVRKRLTDHGIAFRSVGSAGSGKTRVYVVDTDGTLGDNLAKVASSYGIQAESFRGTAAFIGVDSDQSRESAQAEYDRIIREYTSRYVDRRHYERPNQKLALDVRRPSQHDLQRPVIIGIGRLATGDSRA